LTYHGQEVSSRRSDTALEAIAQLTGGAMLRIGIASVDLGDLYTTRIAPVAERTRDRMRAPERHERYGVFVLAALSLGLGASWPGLRRFSVLAVLAMVAFTGASSSPKTAAEAVASGEAAFAARLFPQALTSFEQAVALDPNSAIPRYNAAATLFELGHYEEAESRYREARERADAGLRTKIDYALGNVAVALGSYREALRLYDSCLASTVPGPVYDAVRRDAFINRQFAEQQQPPPEETEAGRDRGAAQKPAPRGTPKSSESDPNAPSQPSSSRGAGNPGDPNARPGGQRRAGGEGESGESNPARSAAETQLEDAIRNAREARQRRISEEPVSAPDQDRKDW
jgi:Ca-activated chloride channel family protein